MLGEEGGFFGLELWERNERGKWNDHKIKKPMNEARKE